MNLGVGRAQRPYISYQQVGWTDKKVKEISIPQTVALIYILPRRMLPPNSVSMAAPRHTNNLVVQLP